MNVQEPVTVHVLALVVDVTEADLLVQSFRESGSVLAGAVAPWDRAASPSSLDEGPSTTLHGLLLTAGAECRWRTDGDRCSVSLFSDTSLPGLGLEGLPGQLLATDVPLWHGGTPCSPEGAPVPVVLQSWHLDGHGQVDRLVVTEGAR